MANLDALDVAALRALAGTAQLSRSEAAEYLESSQVAAEDISDALRPVWVAATERIRQRLPLDLVAMRPVLQRESPAAWTLACEVLTSVGVDGLTGERLALVREAGIRRRLLESLRAVSDASKGGAPIHELEQLMKDAAGPLGGTRGRVRNCAGDSLAMANQLQARWSGVSGAVLTTGWSDFDEVVTLVPNLISVGARPGVGKSALAAGWVRNWVTAGVRVGLLAYEDDALELESRIVAARAGVDLRTVSGLARGSPAQLEALQEAFAWWSQHEGLLETDDSGPARIEDAIASIRDMRRRGCAVAILDNLTCVRMDGGDERYDLVLERALVDLRDEAKRLNMPVIVLGHLKRGQGDADESRKPPKASDFRNGSAWENASRVILGMWLDGDGVALRVLKQTRGRRDDDFTVTFAREAALATGATLRQRTPDSEPRETPRRYTRSIRGTYDER